MSAEWLADIDKRAAEIRAQLDAIAREEADTMNELDAMAREEYAAKKRAEAEEIWSEMLRNTADQHGWDETNLNLHAVSPSDYDR